MNEPSLYLLTDVMLEVLEKGGTIKLRAVGNSMLPMIRPYKDEIIIKKADKRLAVGQIYLYKSNGQLILHRLVKISDDQLIFKGDNQIHSEVGISKSQVIGKLIAINRQDRKIICDDWRFCVYSLYSFVIYLFKKIRSRF